MIKHVTIFQALILIRVLGELGKQLFILSLIELLVFLVFIGYFKV